MNYFLNSTVQVSKAIKDFNYWYRNLVPRLKLSTSGFLDGDLTVLAIQGHIVDERPLNNKGK